MRGNVNRKVYSWKDVKAEEQMNLLFHKTKAEAQRLFLSAMERDTKFASFARDYRLLYVGDFDLETAELVGRLPEDQTPYSEVEAIMAKKSLMDDIPK